MFELARSAGLEAVSCDAVGWVLAGPRWLALGVVASAVHACHGHERDAGVPEALGAARRPLTLV